MNEELKKNILKQYHDHGWCKIENCIPKEYIDFLYKTFLDERIRQEELGLNGQSKDFGSGVYWQGIDSLSKKNKELFDIYTSNLTQEVLKIFLDEAYCFIEEAIVKMPGEDFFYTEHIDRVGGPDPDMVSNPLYDQITVAWILTDLTEENGTLEFKEKDEYIAEYAKAGDIMVWKDDLWHRSGPNRSKEPRIIWINFFTKHPIGRTSEISKDYYDLRII